ncbi:MAG: tRNA (adenosine(37)-N6)-dimethylallyltransferase MiaA [Actinomycetota bacterium]
MTKVLGLVGPTAAGKTELSLGIGERLDAEIVSVDSMQVYRGMDIGTAKPTPSELARVPHHLIDLYEPSHEITVAEFQHLARVEIEQIASRGSVPLLVGGSGLYFRAVVDRLEFPPRSADLRATLEAEAEDVGAETLHARLVELDPAAAAKIEPGNARRTIRALEAIELTGRPFSENKGWDRYESVFDLTIIGLTRDRPELQARIEARVDRMLADGLIEEARGLRSPSRTARQALGYRQILDRPDAPVSEIRAEIARATRRFARRQESWFRSDPRVTWLDAAREDLEEAAIRHLTAAQASEGDSEPRPQPR